MPNIKYSDHTAEKQAPVVSKTGQVIPLRPVKKDETGRVIAGDISKSFINTVTAPKAAEIAVTLWCMFTHAFDHAKVSPRLLFWSPTPECGKTEALKFVTSLSRGAIPSSNVSPALLPRLFESRKACPPTLIIDEYDSMSKEKQSALTNIYNSGHDKAMAYSLLLVREGDDWKEKRLSTWGPIALATKEKELTPASMSRSIVIRLEHDPDSHHPSGHTSQRRYLCYCAEFTGVLVLPGRYPRCYRCGERYPADVHHIWQAAQASHTALAFDNPPTLEIIKASPWRLKTPRMQPAWRPSRR